VLVTVMALALPTLGGHALAAPRETQRPPAADRASGNDPTQRRGTENAGPDNTGPDADDNPDNNPDNSPGNSVRLASQTPWVGPGQEMALRVVATTTRPPSQVEVAVAVYRRVTSRSEFTRTLESRPRTAPLSVTSTTLSDLTTDAGGAVLIRLPVQDPNRTPEWPRLRLSEQGVYPVRVELRELGGGASLADLVTHLVYATPPSQEGRPLGVALVLPAHAPPAVKPDGRQELAPDAVEPLGALARSLISNPAVPLTLAPTPETLQALSRSPAPGDVQTLRQLAQGLKGRQVAAATYVPIALPALMAAGLDNETVAQLDRGSEVINRTLGVLPDPGTWVTDGPLDAAAIQLLRQQRSDRLVVAESALEPADLPITLAQPFELDARAVRRPDVMAADGGLSADFEGSDDPVLAAHRLLADLAIVYFDRPGRFRSVVAAAPRTWRPTTAFLDALLGGLATSPILAGSTLDTAFATPPATTASGAPLVRRLATPKPGPATGPATPATPGAPTRDARRRLVSFSSMLAADNPLDEKIEELLLVSQDADLRPRDRAGYLEGFETQVARELDQIDVPRSRSITLTARNGEIPVTILNKTDYPVRLQVQVVSDKLDFPGGAVRDVDLARRNTTERFLVEARASGTFSLRVNLVSPDGALVLGRSRLTVRSTAASGVGVFLSAGAGGFLLLWWARHQLRGRRSRRNRRLVPA